MVKCVTRWYLQYHHLDVMPEEPQRMCISLTARPYSTSVTDVDIASQRIRQHSARAFGVTIVCASRDRYALKARIGRDA